MHFYDNSKKKLLMLWSPKCGCSSLKDILHRYYKIEYIDNPHGTSLDKKLKNKILAENYDNHKIILLYRNPYHRLVSGFINKYVQKNNKKPLENPPDCDCFLDFVNILYHNPELIETHHFSPQTSNIGYDFFLSLNKKIDIFIDTPNVNYIADILSVKHTHKNGSYCNNKSIDIYTGNIPEYLLDYNTIKNHQFYDYSKFYNNDIKQLVDKIYKTDLVFFKNNNILF